MRTRTHATSMCNICIIMYRYVWIRLTATWNQLDFWTDKYNMGVCAVGITNWELDSLCCNQIPIFGGNDYCLLAMKEDPEEKPPPDAAPGSVPPAVASASSHTRTRPTRSSDTEIVDAYEDLMEVALLFSNETGLLDIKQVHLVFHRQSWAPNIESGMPTLRRFIRPSDWDRIEQMIQNVINPPPADIERRCYFRHPMLFRVPGSSRSYICSRETYITLGQPSVYPIDQQRPIHFRMHLSSFDSSQIRRPREQELEGIDEEWLNIEKKCVFVLQRSLQTRISPGGFLCFWSIVTNLGEPGTDGVEHRGYNAAGLLTTALVITSESCLKKNIVFYDMSETIITMLHFWLPVFWACLYGRCFHVLPAPPPNEGVGRWTSYSLAIAEVTFDDHRTQRSNGKAPGNEVR